VEDPAPPPASLSTFLCRLCGRSIQTVSDLFITALGVTHIACLERECADPLTDGEESRLIRLCWDHEVAVCGVCGRKYRIHELGADPFHERFQLCPICRVDLTPSVRQHIADCSRIRLNDPWWQANTREALARARETRKASQQVRDAAELARVESEV